MTELEREELRAFDSLWQLREELLKVPSPTRRREILEHAITSTIGDPRFPGHQELAAIVRRFCGDLCYGQ